MAFFNSRGLQIMKNVDQPRYQTGACEGGELTEMSALHWVSGYIIRIEGKAIDSF